MQAPPLGIPAGHPLRDTILICRIRLAGLFNMGGAAVANYVSILERIR